MRISHLMVSAVAACWLCGVAVAQDEPALWPSEVYEYETTTGVQDKERPKAAADEKIAPPKVEPAPKAEAPSGNGSNGCCAKSNGNGCANGNGCGKKNGNGCGKKNGCGNGCEEEEDECPCYLFGPEEAWVIWDELLDCGDDCEPLFKVAGWLAAGYHSENEPLSVERGDLLSYNDVPDELILHQGYIYAERTTNTECRDWDFGFRVDLCYGTDAQKMQAFGNPPAGNPQGWDNEWDHGVYGWAMPQCYGTVAYGDLTVNAGHFYTKNGYEVIPTTGNFFWTHSLAFFNTEPFTHTGVISTYKASDDLEIYAGWTLGWDTGFDQFENGNNWHGGFMCKLTDDVKFTYVSCIGDFGQRGKDAYMHSLILDVTLCDKWNYVVHSDYLRIDSAPDGTPLGDEDVGIVQYLFYTHNDCWKFGVRGEWWHNDGDSYNVITYGVNYHPHANFVIRPEMRHTWSPATDVREDGFAIDGVLTF